MKKIFLVLMSAFITVCLSAQKRPMDIRIWPDGPAEDNGITSPESTGDWGMVTNVSEAHMYVYKASRPNGTAIIMCPGGGYFGLSIDSEGHDMAQWMTGEGITYIVLKYRMPNGHPEIPLADVQEAIRIVRENAGEWGVDRVGVMGSSAGGHLAASAANLFTSEENRPDFQILLYPVIEFGEFEMGPAVEAFFGKEPRKEDKERFNLLKHVSRQSPKAFITASADDPTVPVSESIRYFSALNEAGVSASMHIYPTGGHGWGYGEHFRYHRDWTDELMKWLREENLY